MHSKYYRGSIVGSIVSRGISTLVQLNLSPRERDYRRGVYFMLAHCRCLAGEVRAHRVPI